MCRIDLLYVIQRVKIHCNYCICFVCIVYIVFLLEGLREDWFYQLCVPRKIKSLLLLLLLLIPSTSDFLHIFS